ncbi:hypothetical protein SAM23877_3012 [Streptomyces ambofaciens ATCC 23877]|uniref:Uncharacterized protein n=1 Tax=Streptomyces ambofaciens (strain ATCC 23877 / 3486 / DSM 40053 / JCM 4204 / NBRC 12836 / NRRL B-2516) TaxID=278992 RepID=A0A0K2AT13_STRA7|nr:hypothetical protein SAM23877_3012 [Streptomyces ambofaciens ATCC 23877]
MFGGKTLDPVPWLPGSDVTDLKRTPLDHRHDSCQALLRAEPTNQDHLAAGGGHVVSGRCEDACSTGRRARVAVGEVRGGGPW